MTFKKGDDVLIMLAGRTVEGWIIMASPNGRSLALGFHALLGGYAGMMPVLETDGVYRDLLEGREVTVWRKEP